MLQPQIPTVDRHLWTDKREELRAAQPSLKHPLTVEHKPRDLGGDMA